MNGKIMLIYSALTNNHSRIELIKVITELTRMINSDNYIDEDTEILKKARQILKMKCFKLEKE